MRKFIFIAICCPFLTTAQGKAVHFEQGLSWEQICEKAKCEDKFVFLDCYATWCGPCKEMEMTTFTNEELAEFINEHFISVRVQMDTSRTDGDNVKKWYLDAREFRMHYKINGYPSFLFFSSDGSIVHKELGYRNAFAFLPMVKEVVSRKNEYYVLLRDYQNGNGSYKNIPYLAITSQSLGDKGLADSIATFYLTKYLDTLDEQGILKEGNLQFIGQFVKLVSSDDRIFQIILKNQSKIDKLVNDDESFSYYVIDNIIAREDIAPYLYNQKRPIDNPDWNQIFSRVSEKCNNLLADKIMLDAKISYYKFVNNWVYLVKYFIEKTDKYGVDTAGDSKYWSNNQINDYIFMHSKSKTELEKAIKWMKIIVDSDPNDGIDMDTYANLLYKLGRDEEAIIWEEKALSLAPRESEIRFNLQKMRNGKPTWPIN